MTYAESNYAGSAIASNNQAAFTFSYLDVSEIRVDITVGSTTTTYSTSSSPAGFTVVSPNQYVTLSSHPADADAIRIYRVTNLDTTQATFVAGSAISANDLNNNYKQTLQAAQETRLEASTATTTANTAKTTADSATTTANTANSTATSAASDAASAVTTANTASTNATTAVTTANSASTSASNAVSTANTASSNASTALSTANTASTNATSAVSTANTAATNATTALSTANTAASNASTALSTANTASSTASTASTNASNAVTTANAASATATAAQTAVANAAFYSPVANVAAIPGSPSDEDRVEVADSTGIQSFSPLTGYPSGFTGASGLTARIQYSSSGSTWNWVDYFANDPETRYFTKTSGDTNTTNIATNVTNIGTKMPLAGGTFSGAVNFDDNVIIKGDSTNGSGKLTLNCENNSHGVHIKGPPHSAAATYTLTLPNNTGTNGQALLTNGSGVMSWGTVTTDLSGVLALTGGTMTGALTLSGAPTASLHAASKQYVDDSAILVADGGNFDSGSSLVTSSSTYDGGSFD